MVEVKAPRQYVNQWPPLGNNEALFTKTNGAWVWPVSHSLMNPNRVFLHFCIHSLIKLYCATIMCQTEY
jgi:hypothetical protein